MNKVKVRGWEVCCNGMMTALIEECFEFPEIEGTTVPYFFIQGNHLKFCPFCGIELPHVGKELEVHLSK